MALQATITLAQSSMQFFPSLLLKNNGILRNDGSFSSRNNFKRLQLLNLLN